MKKIMLTVVVTIFLTTQSIVHAEQWYIENRSGITVRLKHNNKSVLTLAPGYSIVLMNIELIAGYNNTLWVFTDEGAYPVPWSMNFNTTDNTRTIGKQKNTVTSFSWQMLQESGFMGNDGSIKIVINARSPQSFYASASVEAFD